MSLTDSISAGINNPDCAFFVGQSIGVANSGTLILKVTAIYFGVKIIDKILFKGIPNFWRWINRGKKAVKL